MCKKSKMSENGRFLMKRRVVRTQRRVAKAVGCCQYLRAVESSVIRSKTRKNLEKLSKKSKMGGGGRFF
jgi:hypothetical protein